jgi:hypothetical protein
MNLLKIKLVVIALIVFAASSAFASLSYDVSIDTSSIAGQSGYLYLQFNPGPSLGSISPQPATATVQNFSFTGGGSLGAQDTVDIADGAAVSGTLPGAVSFANTNAVNDYLQAIQFDNGFSFLLTLDGLGVTAPVVATSQFTVSLFSDAGGNLPLLTTSGQVYEQNTPTPIPAAAWLLGSGLFGLIGLRRKIKK